MGLRSDKPASKLPYSGYHLHQEADIWTRSTCSRRRMYRGVSFPSSLKSVKKALALSLVPCTSMLVPQMKVLGLSDVGSAPASARTLWPLWPRSDLDGLGWAAAPPGGVRCPWLPGVRGAECGVPGMPGELVAALAMGGELPGAWAGELVGTCAGDEAP